MAITLQINSAALGVLALLADRMRIPDGTADLVFRLRQTPELGHERVAGCILSGIEAQFLKTVIETDVVEVSRCKFIRRLIVHVNSPAL